MAAAIQIYVATFAFDPEDEPVPLKIVTDLAASNYARLIVTPRFIEPRRQTADVVIMIDIFTVPPLTADVEPDVKTGPVALRRRSRRDLFHFFSTCWLCPRKRSAPYRDSTQGDRQASQLFHGAV